MNYNTIIMKQFLLTAALSVGAIFSTSVADAAQKHVDTHLTTTNGCDVHIVGDVTYSFFPPSLSFHGSATVGPPCTPVTYTFRSIAPGTPPGPAADMDIVFSSNDACNVGPFNWVGEPSLVTDLNSPANQAKLATEFADLCDE